MVNFLGLKMQKTGQFWLNLNARGLKIEKFGIFKVKTVKNQN
jgi:hypothetical protein